jgi:hypothetical protein
MAGSLAKLTTLNSMVLPRRGADWLCSLLDAAKPHRHPSAFIEASGEHRGGAAA